MKLAYLCPYAHINIIEKHDQVSGRLPDHIQCTHLHCGTAASLHESTIIDELVPATHTFYRLKKGDLGSLEEIEYCEAGGLLFKEIPGNQPKNVINEIRNTEEVIQLATYLSRSFPERIGIMTPVQTAIDIISGNVVYEHGRQHDLILAFLKGRGIDPYDEKEATGYKDLSTVVIGILKAYL